MLTQRHDGENGEKAMRKTIVRTISAVTIKSANVSFVNGQPVVKSNDPIILNGNIAEEKALKEVRKAYGETAQITSITQVNDVYEISVSDFIKYATKIDKPNPEQVQEGAAE
jgi:hypothetical protein